MRVSAPAAAAAPCRWRPQRPPDERLERRRRDLGVVGGLDRADQPRAILVLLELRDAHLLRDNLRATRPEPLRVGDAARARLDTYRCRTRLQRSSRATARRAYIDELPHIIVVTQEGGLPDKAGLVELGNLL